MISIILRALQTFNELITAGIAITAFSLLLYALTFNLRDRVARSFAIILISVVVVFVGDTIASTTVQPWATEFWLRLQWVGIIFLPAAYLQFSDAILATTGRPSRGRRRLFTRLAYVLAFGFLVTLPTHLLVGPLVISTSPAPHLQRTWLTWMFTLLYGVAMVAAWWNFWRAYQRTVTSSSRRRMKYLIAGSLAPALGSYPYLLFGYGIAANHAFIFWIMAALSNILVSVLLVIMAYSVAFFGVPWPDRVVKRRLFKWLMRGPITAITVLALTTVVRRIGLMFNISYSAAVPITMVGSLLIIEHLITIVSPLWERWLFHGGDKTHMQLLTSLEERLLTLGDLRQFLESILATVCDRLQVSEAFAATLNPQGLEMIVTAGSGAILNEDVSKDLLEIVARNGFTGGLFAWGNYWLVPLFDEGGEDGKLLGLLGVSRHADQSELDEDQQEALALLTTRAALALEDRFRQQVLVSSLETLTPEVDMIQRLRAASRYDGANILAQPDALPESSDVTRWVKDALTHYWGGPKLTQSPLLELKVVQDSVDEHEGIPANALRAVLTKAIEQTRPEGERRFTGEWILYNILNMKFLEGHKVRDIAKRLAMSEADLYRKQRVAIETVAAAIVEMEEKAREEKEDQENDIQVMQINQPS
jgi:hypothetical protein